MASGKRRTLIAAAAVIMSSAGLKNTITIPRPVP
jgi:hypothetical protein